MTDKDILEYLKKYIDIDLETHREIRKTTNDRDNYCFEDGMVMAFECVKDEIAILEEGGL